MKQVSYSRILCRQLNRKTVFFLSLLFQVYFISCEPTPLAVYDFDYPSTMGWVVSDGISDDQGIVYKTPKLFTVSHFEGAQYPNHFPGSDPLNDGKGCLYVNGFQFGPWAQNSSFPNSSLFWEISVYKPALSAKGSQLWQQLKGIKVSIGDNYGATPGHITANIGVVADINGKETSISELDANGKPLYHPVNHQTTGKWSNITANLKIPSNALVYKAVIKIRGDWKNYHTYEGGIMIDQVESIK